VVDALKILLICVTGHAFLIPKIKEITIVINKINQLSNSIPLLTLGKIALRNSINSHIVPNEAKKNVINSL
jgi:hypothetical protein